MPKPATTPPLAIAPPSLEDVLRDMKATYDLDPVKAVRGQGFIKMLHKYIADDLRSRLTTTALRDGVEVKEEVKLFGSHKPDRKSVV